VEYDGQYKSGKKSGNGIETVEITIKGGGKGKDKDKDKNIKVDETIGEKYEGSFRDDKRHGKGQLVRTSNFNGKKDGIECEGTWVNGVMRTNEVKVVYGGVLKWEGGIDSNYAPKGLGTLTVLDSALIEKQGAGQQGAIESLTGHFNDGRLLVSSMVTTRLFGAVETHGTAQKNVDVGLSDFITQLLSGARSWQQ
jgi:hypothetical protein